jgi:hypothetical protein
VSESYVDLTYHGLSLGRRLRLTQIRPSSGHVELPAPMPVGTQLAVSTDDGTMFDAIVTWIHEQVAGSDRAPGMIVAPELTAAPAAAWWTARVSLPDEPPKQRMAPSPGRPVTVLPRSHADPAPPSPPRASEVPAADLPARDSPEPALHGTAEHEVIDDGKPTMIMPSIDPATIGLDAGASGALPRSDAAGDGEAVETGDDTEPDDSDGVDAHRADDFAESVTIPDGAPPSPGGGRRKRKSRR